MRLHSPTACATDVFAFAFDSRTRARAAGYVGDRIDDLHLGHGHACAAVRGTRRTPYRTSVDLAPSPVGDALMCRCSCPIGDGLAPCKHVWALLLRAEASAPEVWMASRPNASTVVHDADVFEVYATTPQNQRRVEDWLDNGIGLVPVGANGFAAYQPPPRWREQLDVVRQIAGVDKRPAPIRAKPVSHIEYVIDAEDWNPDEPELCVALYRRRDKKRGTARAVSLDIKPDEIVNLADPTDRQLCAALLGSGLDLRARYDYQRRPRTHYATVGPSQLASLVPAMCATGRFGYVEEPLYGGISEAVIALRWDGDEAFVPRLRLSKQDTVWRTDLVLERGEESLAPEVITGLPCRDLAIVDDRLIRLQRGTAAAAWLTLDVRGDMPEIDDRELPDLFEQLSSMPAVPQLDLAGDSDWRIERAAPRPRLRFDMPKRAKKKMRGSIDFVYGDQLVDGTGHKPLVMDVEGRALLRRDVDAEERAVGELAELPIQVHGTGSVTVQAADFVPVARALLEADWLVEAEGQPLRRAGQLSTRLTTDIDWFEVEVAADFGDAQATLPALLEAAQSRSRFVTLSDGSRGILPESWLAQLGLISATGAVRGNRLQFAATQASLVDALLAVMPQVDVDAQFDRLRGELRSFEGVAAADAPATFRGQLREYQREGLGWLRWLRRMGFGGCLADDMGLGKTVQVLALLAGARADADVEGPCLVVAPRSLTHNWLDEAARFTPALRTLDYRGSNRAALREQFDDVDVIVTTYGTLRRDITHLADTTFDTVILDEAQAIKNASSQTAKTCCALRARHRLALTGTPVENRLSDLGSIFQFINPGMLVKSKQLAGLASPDVGPEGVALLARALRPFLLRRTKQQVLDDLPDKTEQIIYCALGKQQRKHYDQLRDHYRRVLKKQLKTAGLAKTRFQALEALLRLRQAACHPALIDEAHAGVASAKLDELVDRLLEVAATGHKALVFSQFTTLLALVRDRLDDADMTYEYLDGRTRKRKTRVQRFQADPNCAVFLISLKAGGHGLNLTAADYVFLLDPWWNPAVEAQAIDRAHRIGQNRTVFAYRLIAEDTVEDKILQLQEQKRELAEGIFADTKAGLASLTAEDLELLLA